MQIHKPRINPKGTVLKTLAQLILIISIALIINNNTKRRNRGKALAFTSILTTLTAFYLGRKKGNQKLYGLERNKLQQDIEKHSKAFLAVKDYQDKKKRLIDLLIKSFEESAGAAKKFLIDEHMRLQENIDQEQEYSLISKSRPALKASEQVKASNKEKREWKRKAKEYSLLLAEIEGLFPDIMDYIETLNEDKVIKSKEDHISFEITDEEYGKLSPIEKDELSIKRYRNKNHNKKSIGNFYERYLGYLYEKDGYEVTYYGLNKGLEDMGIDLIAENKTEVLIIQAKCWSDKKIIREKHVFNLYATTYLRKLKTSKDKEFKPVFITTTNFSEIAEEIASDLGITLKNVQLDKNYPLIKCNINNKEKIYHLPTDQQYDNIKIDTNKDEFYAKTIQEAVNKGFRRAKKWMGDS